MASRFVSFFLLVSLFFASVIPPASANSLPLGFVIDNHRETKQENYYGYLPNNKYRKEVQPNKLKKFGKSVIDGGLTVAGFAVGRTVACYALDGIASSVFPPAASLSTLCPAVGGSSAGFKVIRKLAY